MMKFIGFLAMSKNRLSIRPVIEPFWQQCMVAMLLLLIMMHTSCRKDPDQPRPVLNDTTIYAAGIYVLNEGLFNQNNAGLTFFNFSDSTAETDYFFNKNGRGLGDTGSDACIYGSKLYIVVNVSSQLEVVDAASGISLSRIPLFNGSKPRQPRKIAPYGKYIFVCNFDNTVAVIDTARLEVISLIEAGRNPDGITAAYGKIWVSNSGGLAFPAYDNTVSVIDPETFTEVSRFTVGINPYTIRPDGHGNLYLISRGNYDDVKSRLQVLDASGNLVKTFGEFEALGFAIAGDTAYVYNYDWNSGKSSVMVINTLTMQPEDTEFIKDGTPVRAVYGIAHDPATDLIYISDALNFTGTGRVHAFDKAGNRQFSFNTGINPSGFAFLHRMNIQGN
ncbi:hypothetical protein SDC9_41214 [bioreactor metagenome]|uniref:YncE family protein n=1 Tax=bioreactor metagenome TaxID=1076179 RepID=A0A644VUH8_9ZZZZ|nr:YncE family protein [Lentimicrobium sp.]